MAGSVEAAGKKVTKFQPGEEGFGGLNERGLSLPAISGSSPLSIIEFPRLGSACRH
jgi:NADPH:quinone reductase-like Zn-dependent oxidoreductase